jgi:hypothetical protein
VTVLLAQTVPGPGAQSQCLWQVNRLKTQHSTATALLGQHWARKGCMVGFTTVIRPTALVVFIANETTHTDRRVGLGCDKPRLQQYWQLHSRPSPGWSHCSPFSLRQSRCVCMQARLCIKSRQRNTAGDLWLLGLKQASHAHAAAQAGVSCSSMRCCCRRYHLSR